MSVVFRAQWQSVGVNRQQIIPRRQFETQEERK